MLTPVLAALALPLQSQVHVVDSANGPGTDFQFLPSAVAAAADGDILLIRQGGYFPFDLAGKSLTLIAEVGATPSVLGPNPGLGIEGVTRVSNLAAGQFFAARGVELPVLECTDVAGQVWFEGAEFGAVLVEVDAALFVDAEGYGRNAFLDLVGATSEFETPAIDSTDSGLAIERSELFGGRGQAALQEIELWAGHGAPGLTASGGTIRTAVVEVTGGQGGKGVAFASSGTCPPAGDGGAGVDLAGSTATLANTILTGGPGGTVSTFPTCSDGSLPPLGNPGPPQTAVGSSVAQVTAPLAELTANAPVREGQSVQIAIDAPGAVGLIIVGTAPASGLAGSIDTALFVGGSTLVLPLAAGPGGPGLSAPIGDLGAGVEGAVLFAQGAALLADLTFRRTEPTVLVLLDAGL